MTNDAVRDPELFAAIASGYALVSTAAHDLQDAEIERLKSWGEAQGFDGADLDELAERCRAVARAVVADASNRRPAFDAVRAVGSSGKRATMVLAAARVAVVADSRLEEAEEGVLRQIAEALGLDPETA